MPLGGDLEAGLRDALWTSVADFEQQRPVSAAARASALQIIGAARLERMLDVLQQTHGPEPIREFLSVLRGDRWNRNHAAIAALAGAGFLPQCITLNFDRLIEHAVAARGNLARTICPLRDGAGFSTRDGCPSIQIIKPHGSLAPTDYVGGEFDLLAPTLAEVGNQPDARNQSLLTSLLAEGRCLLSAGYSDHDWDVFPILQNAARSMSHVYWVAFLNPADVDRRAIPGEEGFVRVRQWLMALSPRSTLLLGDPRVLLEQVCARLRLAPLAVADDLNPHAKRAPTGQFLSGPDQMLATSVSFALLLQDRGRFHDHLVRWLLERSELRKRPLLASRLHRTAAHSCHTRRNLRGALRHMRQCVTLKEQATHGSAPIADELIWMGYEHLCLIKRPSWRWAAIIPMIWNWYRGIQLMRRGLRFVRPLPRRERRKLRAMTRFYRGDLLQSWAGLPLFIGGIAGPISRWLFRRATVWYDRARRIDATSMGWEYYWLRSLEARLLAGTPIDNRDAVLQQIDDLEWSYAILQNHVQRGNTLAYRALIAGSAGRDDPAKLLKEAETIWSAEDGFVPSGLMRVIMFRRALGLTGLAGTLLAVRALRRTIRQHQAGDG